MFALTGLDAGTKGKEAILRIGAESELLLPYTFLGGFCFCFLF